MRRRSFLAGLLALPALALPSVALPSVALPAEAAPAANAPGDSAYMVQRMLEAKIISLESARERLGLERDAVKRVLVSQTHSFMPAIWADDLPGLCINSQYLIRYLADGVVVWDPVEMAAARKLGVAPVRYGALVVEDVVAVQNNPTLRRACCAALREDMARGRSYANTSIGTSITFGSWPDDPFVPVGAYAGLPLRRSA